MSFRMQGEMFILGLVRVTNKALTFKTSTRSISKKEKL